jgi:dCMP deaminase
VSDNFEKDLKASIARNEDSSAFAHGWAAAAGRPVSALGEIEAPLLARQLKWDLRFMALAALVGRNSLDPHRQVGCAVVDDFRAVVSTGYNGLPRRVRDLPARYERPVKNLYVVHAEENAVADAARRGASLLAATAYSTRFPCPHCAGLLIQARVAAVVSYAPNLLHPRHGEEWEAALVMLREAQVEVRFLEEER